MNLALQNQIDSLLTAPELKNAVVGIHVCALATGETLYERHRDLSLTPASNLKLLTAIAALNTLGPSFRYATTLFYTGTIDASGALVGDVYLRGSGDPSLTSDRLLEMVEALWDAGITAIQGRIVADATAFDAQRLGVAWQWDEEPYYYSAQIAGLNCDENTVVVQVSPGATAGEPARIVLGGDDAERLAFAGTTYVSVRNTAMTTTADSPETPEAKLSFGRTRARNELLVGGTLPVGAAPVTKRLTVEDPARFTATRFAELCRMRGIAFPPIDECVDVGATPPEAAQLSVIESAPLTELVRAFLKQSNNLFGEAFLKTLGKETASAGVQVVLRLLDSWGLDTSGAHLFDGSGLSRMNALPPRLLTDLLRHIDREITGPVRYAFLDALPIAGVDGTLDDRMRDSPAASRVRAKTGSLDNCSSIAGYLETRSGERLVFAIVMNHFALSAMSIARRMQDALLIALVEH